MTSPTSPPNRRGRWRVVAVAVLLLVLGWLFWPRSDRRFVGTWDVFAHGRSTALSTMHLGANGLGWSEEKRSGRRSGFSWSASGHNLLLGEELTGSLASLRALTAPMIKRITGAEIVKTQQDYIVLQLDDDRIQLRLTDSRGIIVELRRSP